MEGKELANNKTKVYARTYAFDVWYHSAETTPNTWPSMSSRAYSTSAERDAALTRDMTEVLIPQGYTVTRVERHSLCGRCEGTGTITIKPRGRKNAAWFLCTQAECPECLGNYRTIETVAR